MNFINIKEAKILAQEIKLVPESFIREVTEQIVNAIAAGSSSIIISKTDIITYPQWKEFQKILKNAGWNFRLESSQFDGQWLNIELPTE